ncbi:MAG: D-Ala-D-Ala carboxypeptidase family metallohydrolase [Halobacteriovoraceae bacterium]|nr:D-Ala-D-Ala carboxypeptidase family metallohydrolase [Halobacteriovoraceae bacterium]
MKKLILIISLIFVVSCSHSNRQEGEEVVGVVVDTPKPDSYYEEHACDDHVPFKNSIGKGRSTAAQQPEPSPNRKIASASDLYGMAGNQGCSDLTRSELDDLEYSARRLNGSLIDPRDYEKSTEGLQNYLNDVGVISKFSANEMVQPNKPGHAQNCGYKSLRPVRCRWPSGAVQGLLAGELRGVINGGDPYGAKKITLRNWWRPSCYNKKVGGAKASDHMQARGFDLDFSSAQDRAKAQKYLCDLYREEPFNLQVGIGCRTLHIGMGSPKRLGNHAPNGSRFWTYGSLQSCGGLKRLNTDKCWLIDRSGNKRIYSSKNGFKGAL